MNAMEALHRFEIFGLVAYAATSEDAAAIVAKLRAAEALAAQASHMPDLLTRLEESDRRFDAVRRSVARAETELTEARRVASTALVLPEVTRA